MQRNTHRWIFYNWFNPNLMLYKPFPLLFSDFRFQFASLCTTNFWGFWFFWMAFSCTSIVRKYCWLPLSVHCTSSYALSLQERSWLPSWRPSVLTSVWQFLSSSSSHPPAWVCIWLCWLSSMREGLKQVCVRAVILCVHFVWNTACWLFLMP